MKSDRLRGLVLACRIEAGEVEGVVALDTCRTLRDPDTAQLAKEIRRALAWTRAARAAP